MLEADQSSVVCPMFYTGEGCMHTYAQHLGETYLTFRVVYTILVMACILYSFPKTSEMWRIKQFRWSTVQTRIHVYMAIGMLSLVVRAVDPQGYNDDLPYAVLVLMYDIGGMCLFSIGYEIIFDWQRLVNLSQGNQQASSYLRGVCIIFQCLAGFCCIFFGLMTTLVGPIWIWHLVKIVCLMVLSVTSMAFFLKYGMQVWRILLQTEADEQQPDNEYETFRNLKAALDDPQKAITEGVPTDLLHQQLTKHRLTDRDTPSAVSPVRASRKQPKLMLLIFISSLVLLVVWVYVLVLEVSYKATQSHPPPAPEHVWHVLAASTLDIVHFVCFVSVPIFFGTTPNRSPRPNTHVEAAQLPQDSLANERLLPASALFSNYVPSTIPEMTFVGSDSPRLLPITATPGTTTSPSTAVSSPVLLSLRPTSVQPTNHFSLSVNSQSTAKMMLVHKNVTSSSGGSSGGSGSSSVQVIQPTPPLDDQNSKPISMTGNSIDTPTIYAGHTVGSIMAMSVGYSVPIANTVQAQSVLFPNSELGESKIQFQPHSLITNESAIPYDIPASLRLSRTQTPNRKVVPREHTPVRVNTYESYNVASDVQALFDEIEQKKLDKIPKE